MPDRLIRAGTLNSETMNNLSWAGEVFFYRLMLIVDDYGLYERRLNTLRASLYPLKLNQVSEADIAKWLDECSSAGLISFYEVENKEYLEIKNFGQRLRKPKRKFPPPLEEKRREEELEEEENIAPTRIHPLQKFIVDNYKNICTLKQQLTFEESERLVADFDKRKIKEVLDAMENWAALKKNLNVNMTIRNWMKRQTQPTPKAATNQEKHFTQKTIDKFIGASIMVHSTKARGEVTGINGEKLMVIHSDQSKGEYLMNEVFITASAPKRNMAPASIGEIFNQFKK